MNSIWRHFTGLIWLAVIVAGVWLALDAITALSLFSLVSLWLVVYHTCKLYALDQWLRNGYPSPAAVPDGAGVWGEVFIRLARFVRRYDKECLHLNISLDRLQRATSAMPEGIVILGEAGQIEWCNLAAEQHLGLNLKMDAGQHITRMVRQAQFVAYLNSGDFNKPLIIKQLRSQDILLSLQLVPYGDREKLLISRDITRFEKIEIMRRDFIANVSHELRTPLTVIGGFLETLLDENRISGKMEKNALELMAHQATRMQRLVEDLLTLSRLENTQNTLCEESVDVVKLLRGLHQEARSLSAGRHVITLNILSDAMVLGSEDELRSAFGNLVSNAVRYTPEGGKISLNWTLEKGKGLFYVQDTGIGIESEYIPRLTERFYRVDRSRSRETGGTGLGLAIVKHVLNRHQASLEIASELGVGSTFRIKFPASRVLPVAPGAAVLSTAASEEAS
ncbi:phosphate regulon sensor histidine kinase PhoR [Nitrosomonas halophila]|uniref:Phosphate regulon sensor protein PhoR n=1 Tax=Nitrosomonas halophila TaxID=44576 RepID=A0A1H3FQ63_9PROT|nr:phosphate regulon sensor histidine kinase PhoR [Nitrosomonas halophila]SDX92284.1 two-component system, OmpR family, phosphate regulon sensor histidine kinase PhoR [Nitrosomonas halophila]